MNLLALPAPLASATQTMGSLPLWSVAPFGLMLLSIAVLPLVANHFWEHNRNKAILSVVLGVPDRRLVRCASTPPSLGHTAHEYVAFIILLGALFVIAGGIVVRGTLAGTPGLNTGLLAIGAVLASLIGTTGASMLLIRPLLRANAVRRASRPRRRLLHLRGEQRRRAAHARSATRRSSSASCAACRSSGRCGSGSSGLFVNGVLLVVFYVVDSTVFRREELATPGDLDEVAVEAPGAGPRRRARLNFLYLAGVVAVLLVAGSVHLPAGRAGGRRWPPWRSSRLRHDPAGAPRGERLHLGPDRRGGGRSSPASSSR